MEKHLLTYMCDIRYYEINKSFGVHISVFFPTPNQSKSLRRLTHPMLIYATCKFQA